MFYKIISASFTNFIFLFEKLSFCHIVNFEFTGWVYICKYKIYNMTTSFCCFCIYIHPVNTKFTIWQFAKHKLKATRCAVNFRNIIILPSPEFLTNALPYYLWISLINLSGASPYKHINSIQKNNQFNILAIYIIRCKTYNRAPWLNFTNTNCRLFSKISRIYIEFFSLD